MRAFCCCGPAWAKRNWAHSLILFLKVKKHTQQAQVLVRPKLLTAHNIGKYKKTWEGVGVKAHCFDQSNPPPNDIPPPQLATPSGHLLHPCHRPIHSPHHRAQQLASHPLLTPPFPHALLHTLVVYPAGPFIIRIKALLTVLSSWTPLGVQAKLCSQVLGAGWMQHSSVPHCPRNKSGACVMPTLQWIIGHGEWDKA